MNGTPENTNGVGGGAARRAAPAFTALLAIGLLIAGCGGGSPTGGVAHLGSGHRTTGGAAGEASSAGSSGGGSSPEAEALAYAACMRKHGVPNFPVPQVSTSANSTSVKMAVPAGVAKGNPHFESAQQACRNLIPGGGPGERQISPQEQAQFLQLAACIRAHGVPSFPDPTFSGGGVHLPKGSVNPQSPQVKAAEQACRSLIPSRFLHGGAGSGHGSP